MRAPLRQQIKQRYALAVTALDSGQISSAQADLTDLLKLVPRSAEVHFQLSRIAQMLGQHDIRADHLRTALTSKPDSIALNEAGVDAFSAVNDTVAALAAHDRLIKQDPDKLSRKVDKGMSLQFFGDFTAADSLFRDLIDKHPDEGALYRIYVTTARLDPDDPLIPQMSALLDRNDIADAGKMHIGFALAKVLDTHGDTAAAFARLRAANDLQGKLHPYDRTELIAKNKALRAFQDGASLTPIGAKPAIQSLFVTGMPRSGTTLVEQILASHPGVTAAGELPYAHRLAESLFKSGNGLLPLKDAPEHLIDDFARGYVQMIRRDTGVKSGMVTDKAIQAHRIYGLLHRALSGVRFVVVHRDPRDIALSIYRNHFKLGTHRYANDLGDIAHAIKDFRASVVYWRERLPDAIYEINYDKLVANPESQTKALIAAVGLDWDDSCLSFHKTAGSVKTLSLQQVRQPIYRGSSQAWRKYETELAPFFEAWGDTEWD